jgi:hypothetical protein
MDSCRKISYPMKTNEGGGLLYGCYKNPLRCSITDLDSWNTVRVCRSIFVWPYTNTGLVTDRFPFEDCHGIHHGLGEMETSATLNEVWEEKRPRRKEKTRQIKEGVLVSRWVTSNLNRLYLVPVLPIRVLGKRKNVARANIAKFLLLQFVGLPELQWVGWNKETTWNLSQFARCYVMAPRNELN